MRQSTISTHIACVHEQMFFRWCNKLFLQMQQCGDGWKQCFFCTWWWCVDRWFKSAWHFQCFTVLQQFSLWQLSGNTLHCECCQPQAKSNIFARVEACALPIFSLPGVPMSSAHGEADVETLHAAKALDAASDTPAALSSHTEEGSFQNRSDSIQSCFFFSS